MGDCWKAAKEIGCQDVKRRRFNLDFRDPATGERATTAKRSGEVLVAHLDKLLNAQPNVDPEAIKRVRQRTMWYSLDDAPDIEEIETAARRQNSGKACGDSKIPAEYFKLCLDSKPIMRVLEIIITRAWNEETKSPRNGSRDGSRCCPRVEICSTQGDGDRSRSWMRLRRS